jgi:hypothetical protein
MSANRIAADRRPGRRSARSSGRNIRTSPRATIDSTLAGSVEP